MCSVELKTHKIHFPPELHPGPHWGCLGRSPMDPIVGWRGDRDGDTPRLSPSTPSIGISTSAFAASKSVPNFCHRFMVTLWRQNKFGLAVVHYQCNSKPSSLSANKRSSQFLSASMSTAREACAPDRLAHNNRAR